MIGMVVGAATLRLSNSFCYQWINQSALFESEDAKSSTLRKVILKFTPFTWSTYHWSFFKTPERLFQVGIEEKPCRVCG